jgi:hypothetical protein
MEQRNEISGRLNRLPSTYTPYPVAPWQPTQSITPLKTPLNVHLTIQGLAPFPPSTSVAGGVHESFESHYNVKGFESHVFFLARVDERRKWVLVQSGEGTVWASAAAISFVRPNLQAHHSSHHSSPDITTAQNDVCTRSRSYPRRYMDRESAMQSSSRRSTVDDVPRRPRCENLPPYHNRGCINFPRGSIKSTCGT